MSDMDGLLRDSPARQRYVYRLGRAVLLVALGAVMHLPSPTGPGVLPPAVSPRPFVRVAAQQADSVEAPVVIVAHSLVFAASPMADGVLQARNAGSDMTVGTAGLDQPSHAVALAEVEPAGLAATTVIADSREGASDENPMRETKPVVAEKPLPAVATPPADEPPSIAQPGTPPSLNVSTPPSTYRVQPVVSVARSVSEEELVRQLLDEYTGAFERRDIPATKALYPNVDGKALKRAYEQITSQRLTFESCGITISGSTANARCRGSATFQPRIGTRPVQIASREWTFDLSKQDTSWRIVNTFVR